MLKKKVKWFFFGSVVSILIFFIGVTTFSLKTSSRYFINAIVEKKYHAKVSFDKVLFKKRKFILKNVSVEHAQIEDAKIEKIVLSIVPKWTSFSFSTKLKIIKPQIKIEKLPANFSSFQLSSKKSSQKSLIKTLLIDEGQVIIGDEKFHLEAYISPEIETYKIEKTPEKRAIIQMKIFEGSAHIKAFFHKFDWSFKLDNFFHKDFQVILQKACITGDIQFEMQKGLFRNVKTSLNIQDLQSYIPYTKNIMKIENVSCFIDNLQDQYLSFSDLLTNAIWKLEIENGMIEQLDLAISELFGEFSYHPAAGPKCNFISKAKYKDQPFDFNFNGKAFSKSYEKNWLKLLFSFNFPKRNSEIVAFGVDRKKEGYFLEAELQNLNELETGFLYSIFLNFPLKLPRIDVERANISGQLKLNWNREKIHFFNFSNVQMKEIKLASDKYGRIDIESIDGTISYDHQKVTSDLDIKNASYALNKHLFFKNFDGKLLIENHVILPSNFSFHWNGVRSEIALSGPMYAINASLKADGNVNSFGLMGEDAFAMQFACTFKSKHITFYGNTKIFSQKSDSQILSFGGEIDDLAKIFTCKNYQIIKRAWLRADHIQLDTIPTKFLVKDFKMQGKTSISAFYENEKLNMEVQGNDWKVDSKIMQLDLGVIQRKSLMPLHQGSGVILVYNFRKKQWDIELDSFDAKVLLKQFNLLFDVQKASLSMKNKQLMIALPKVLSNNVLFGGGISFDLSTNEFFDLKIIASKINGDIPSSILFLKSFGLNFDFLQTAQGLIQNKGKGFCFSGRYYKDHAEIDWSVDTNIQLKDLPFERYGNLQNVSTDFNFTSKDQLMRFVQFQGEWNLGNEIYYFRIPTAEKRKNAYVFEAVLEDSIHEIGYLKCKAKEDDIDRIIVEVDPLSHIMSAPFQVNNLVTNRRFIPKSGSIQYCNDQKLFFSSFDSFINFPKQMESIHDLSFSLDFDMQNAFKFMGKVQHSGCVKDQLFEIVGKWERSVCTVQHSSLGDVRFQGDFFFLKDGTECRSGVFHYKNKKLAHLNGKYLNKEKRFQGKLDQLFFDLKDISTKYN
ncbi:MAG TPA: hypothetical protein P5048_05145, partial [Chlamydiales bacterium]|nr:hypothetical protein [Chlamydiales bacterium]